jgi:hypothetical protein
MKRFDSPEEFQVFDRFAKSDALLAKLVEQALAETNPIHYDEICAEIWRILGERERLRTEPDTNRSAA